MTSKRSVLKHIHDVGISKENRAPQDIICDMDRMTSHDPELTSNELK